MTDAYPPASIPHRGPKSHSSRQTDTRGRGSLLTDVQTDALTSIRLPKEGLQSGLIRTLTAFIFV